MQFIDTQFCADGAFRARLQASPGLHQLSVIADATEFDWDELYFELHDYGNDGIKTGPWDFNLLDRNTPLVPAYWVKLNGKPIGLWFFQRVSLEDLEAKRFRGRAAFWISADDVDAAGEISLECVPYRPLKIRWQTALWEPDPEDTLDAGSAGCFSGARLPADEWNEPAFWEDLRVGLGGPHAAFNVPLARALDWVAGKSKPQLADVPLLVASRRLGHSLKSVDNALFAIDEATALPHWGNPQEDGYSHDGDMGAAAHMWLLSWALRAMRNELGRERTERVKAKLRLQGERFMCLALLNRDYWGGSVLQDHGWRSHFGFGAAVMNLLGILPEAETWARYVVPRIRRAVAAMPRDGVIPQSSYGSLFLHLDAVAHYRDAWLACSGQDLYDEAPFHPIVDYIESVVRERDRSMILPNYNGGCVLPFVGGNQFLNHMASKYCDGRAAHLQNLLLGTQLGEFTHGTQEQAFYSSALWGFVSFDAAVSPAAPPPHKTALTHYPDTGMVHFHEAKSDITLTLRCAPWNGWHADRELNGPCDAMAGSPGAGHFVLARGNTPLLVTPDAGYSLQSTLCSCLLIDGKGQFGDVGYPMSIPSWRHRGERILFARWDEKLGEGQVRLELTPAYAEEAGVLSYTREFLISPQRMVCRDVVQLSVPRSLSWLFQGNRANGLCLKGLTTAVFGDEAPLYLEPCTALELKASIRKTPVVYSYSSASGYAEFQHVRYDSTRPVIAATVDFVMALEDAEHL